jgi:CRP-like cAMP-binding protein
MPEPNEILITKFPLFQGFAPDGARMLIQQGHVKEHAPGDVLFKEGDAASEVLLVLTGKLQVFVHRQGKDLTLTDAVPGAIVGELAVLCGIPRSASVRAGEPSTVLHWSAQAFRRILLTDVFLSQRILGQSLRTLIEKERSLIETLTRSDGSHTAH